MRYTRRPTARAIAIARTDETRAARLMMLKALVMGACAVAALMALPLFSSL